MFIVLESMLRDFTNYIYSISLHEKVKKHPSTRLHHENYIN